MISRANVASIEIFSGPIHELSKTRGKPRSMSLVAAGLLGALSGCVAPSGYYPVVSATVYQPPPPAGICGVYPYGSANYSTCMSVNYPNVGQDAGPPAAAIAVFAPPPSFTPPMNTAAPAPIVPPAGTKCQSTTTRTDDPNADSSTTTTSTTCR
jgi:hypothetical protein